MSRPSRTYNCKPPKSWTGECVYKYGRIDTPERLCWLEQSILRQQVYIPKAGGIHDPKKARPKIAPASVGKFIKTLLRLRPAMSPGEEQYHRRVLEYNLPRLGGADLVIQSFEDGLLKQFENQRIYSVSKRPNNLHLWKKYAAGHRGYCLEFRTDGVFKGHIKEVRYRDYYEADITG